MAKENPIVLIVGGAGYIGSHINKNLHENGIDTIVLDNLSRGFKDAVKWGKFYQGDCSDEKLLDQIFKSHKISAVMHFAAFAYVGESVKEPSKYYDNNVIQTVKLLEAMLRNNVKNFIFSSTCATFGNAEYLPIDESHPQRPINPYGRSKLMVEWILKDFETAYGLNYCIFRYFNAAGCDPAGEIGENHEPETHLIPLILQHLNGKLENIKIFGDNYPTHDGTCIRDYIHVSDLANAHRLGFEYLMREGQSQVFNLGVGKGYSILEIIKTAEAVSGEKAVVIKVDKRPGDPAELVGAGEKAKKILGWKPTYSSIEKIIETAWKWETRR